MSSRSGWAGGTREFHGRDSSGKRVKLIGKSTGASRRYSMKKKKSRR